MSTKYTLKDECSDIMGTISFYDNDVSLSNVQLTLKVGHERIRVDTKSTSLAIEIISNY